MKTVFGYLLSYSLKNLRRKANKYDDVYEIPIYVCISGFNREKSLEDPLKYFARQNTIYLKLKKKNLKTSSNSFKSKHYFK